MAVTPEVLDWGVAFLWRRYGLPCYITENGLSCNDVISLDGQVHDPNREDFLHRYLLCLKNTFSHGTDLRGYFHWSLTDNFEWHSGYGERFGLVYVVFPPERASIRTALIGTPMWQKPTEKSYRNAKWLPIQGSHLAFTALP